jgi:parallel beta-helix repeat protein
MKELLFILLLISFSMTSGVVYSQNTPQTFIHPGMNQTRSDLEFMKQKIEAGEQPWKDAFKKLEKSADLDFQPEAFTHVIRGPYGKPSIGGKELSNSADAAYDHALMWYISGNKLHARKAIEIINAWSPVLWDFDDNDAKLLAGWTGHLFCNAAEILRYTHSGWKEKDIEQFEKMLLTAYYPMLMNFFPEANGNWDAAFINTIMCIGIFCDDHEIFDRAVNHFLVGNGNGGITKYIYPSGQCQESTRDMGHTQMGLDYFAKSCQLAWNQGVDLYQTAGNRLALGFEYTAKYMLDEDVPVYGTISDRGRGRFSNVYEVVLQHYKYVKSIDMPYTERAVEKTRRKSSVEVLVSCKGPLDKSPKVFSGAPVASGIALQAGALTASSVNSPSSAIVVLPGDSIQSAIDSAAKTGGPVVLSKGVHTLPAMLKIPSGITLTGEGIETILFLDPELTTEIAGTAIINADYDLHDVILRNFVIEGALAVETSRDPNQERRQRSYQMAPSRAGIIFSGLKDGHMSNIKFEHITVRNNTHQGVAIKGAKQVKIIACDFSDNGSSVVPGNGLQHNLLLTHVKECEVLDSRFDTSPWGNGIHATYSSDVSISNCEAARNALNGIMIVDSKNVTIAQNLLEGNDGSGIIFNNLVESCDNVVVQENTSHYNGEYGLKMGKVSEFKIQNNIYEGNGRGDD